MDCNINQSLNIPNQPYENKHIPSTESNTNNNTSTTMNSDHHLIQNMVKEEASVGLMNPSNQLDKSVVDGLQLAQDTLTSQLNTTSSNTSSMPPIIPIQNSKSINSSIGNAGTTGTITSFTQNKAASNEFVRKLYNILEKNAYPEIVRWTDDGNSFVVIDTGKFTSQILPNHFKHSNFASFVRQLNKYDFHKVKRKPEEKNKYGDLSWEFQHPTFRIHNEAGLDSIKRKITISKKDPDTLNPNIINPNIVSNNMSNATISTKMDTQLITSKVKESLSQNMVSKESFNNLKNKVSRLENELKISREEANNVRVESERMNNKYTTLLESLVTFKTVHENLSNNFNSLCSILVNRGIEIPQNVYNNTIPQKMAQFNLQNGANLNNPISSGSSGSPIQDIHQQSVLGNLENQIPIMNTPTNELLMNLPSSDKNMLQTPINHTNNPPDIANMDNNTTTSNNNNNHNMLNPHTNINDNVNNNNGNNDSNTNNDNKTNMINNSHPTDNNIPTNLDEITLRKGFHVLLVEDDAVSIQLCSRFLRKYGCTVEVVTDGLSAISTLEKFRYDLVLMDIVMPNLDGATATSIVRSFDNHTPIIAMTGNIEDQDLLTYLQHGMNDILAKPFTRNDLHSMLVRYLKDRIPLCEQKQDQSGNNQLSPPIIQNTPSIQNNSQIPQMTSMSPTLQASMIQPPPQQLNASMSTTLQNSAPMDSTPGSQMMSQTNSQPNSRNSSTFEGNEPLLKKQHV